MWSCSRDLFWREENKRDNFKLFLEHCPHTLLLCTKLWCCNIMWWILSYFMWWLLSYFYMYMYVNLMATVPEIYKFKFPLPRCSTAELESEAGLFVSNKEVPCIFLFTRLKVFWHIFMAYDYMYFLLIFFCRVPARQLVM